MAKTSKGKAEKSNFYYLRLPAAHEKSDTSTRLIHRAGNEGYGLYVRLLEKAVPETGFIKFAGSEETIEEQLSFDLSIETDQVKTLLQILKKLGLVERAENESNDLFFREAAEYTTNETPEAARQRRFREKHRKDQESNESPQSNGEALQSNGEALQNNDNNIYNNNYNNNYNQSYKAEIDAILSAYPEKERQETARIEIEERIKEGEEPEKLLNAAKMYAIEMEGVETYRIYPDNFYKRNGQYLNYKDKRPDDIKRRARKRESEKRQPTTKDIPFKNCEQRHYDYKALEAQLLGGPNQGTPNIKRGPGIDYT